MADPVIAFAPMHVTISKVFYRIKSDNMHSVLGQHAFVHSASSGENTKDMMQAVVAGIEPKKSCLSSITVYWLKCMAVVLPTELTKITHLACECCLCFQTNKVHCHFWLL